MTLLDVAGGGTALAGAAVYLWHCDIDGRYSMYDQEIAGEKYLRGVQESDADGRSRSTSIFPAAYAGRWPHIHFEVYESVDAATAAGSKLKTSQIALPAGRASWSSRPTATSRACRTRADVARHRQRVQRRIRRQLASASGALSTAASR